MPDGNIHIDVGHYKHFTRLLCNVWIGDCAKKYCSFNFIVVDYGIICGVHNMASKRNVLYEIYMDIVVDCHILGISNRQFNYPNIQPQITKRGEKRICCYGKRIQRITKSRSRPIR